MSLFGFIFTGTLLMSGSGCLFPAGLYFQPLLIIFSDRFLSFPFFSLSWDSYNENRYSAWCCPISSLVSGTHFFFLLLLMVVPLPYLQEFHCPTSHPLSTAMTISMKFSIQLLYSYFLIFCQSLTLDLHCSPGPW